MAIPYSTRRDSVPKDLPDDLAEPLLGVRHIAYILAKSERSVYHDVQRGHLPQPIRVGGRLRWRPETVREWLSGLEDESGGR